MWEVIEILGRFCDYLRIDGYSTGTPEPLVGNFPALAMS